MAQAPNAHAFSTLLFVRFCERVHEVLGSGTIPSYTPHGLSHIQGVEAAVENLWSLIEEKNPLTPFEKLLLRFCAWSHDLGMIVDVANKYQDEIRGARPGTVKLAALRKDHDKASAYFVQKNVPELFEQVQDELERSIRAVGTEAYRAGVAARLRAHLSDEEATSVVAFFADGANKQRWLANAATLANTVNLIARYHRRAEPIDTAHELRHYLGEPVRVRLLAAIFRLADALHVDRTRFEQTGFEILARSPQFSDESRVHWIKSFIVSSIRIDEMRHSVHVQADVPLSAEIGGDDFAVDSERMRGMVSYIVNDLTEDVLSVSRILLDGGFPPLLGVTSDIHEIPSMHYPDDVRAALNHIYASSSPNTSRLITIALDVLQWHLRESEKKPDGAAYLLQKLKEQRISLAEQLDQRPCHEALRKVHDLLGAVQEAWHHSDFQRGALAELCGERYVLHTLLEGVRATVLDKRREVAEGVRHPDFLEIFDGRSDIILYGYSDQVLALLDKLNASRHEDLPDVHVLECRTKTAYAPAGDLLYLDGERYARALRKQGYKGNVTIEPDAAVGRILTKSVTPLVLLGSNAVYPGGTFVHSMGHLTVAAAAKAPHVKDKSQVVVVTDTMKIGFHHELQLKERHENDWLTTRKHVITVLRKAGIELHNWQEDTVPSELIDALLVLDKKTILRGNYAQLATMRFDAVDVYCRSLDYRLLASYLAYKHVSLDADVKLEVKRRGRRSEDNEDDVDWNMGNWAVAVAYSTNDATLNIKARELLASTWTGRTAGMIGTAGDILKKAYVTLSEKPRKPKEEPGAATAAH